MSAELDARLKKALETRERLKSETQRVLGRKESAEKALREIEDEIRAKNLDPDTLEEKVILLTKAYEEELSKVELSLTEAQSALNPFLEMK